MPGPEGRVVLVSPPPSSPGRSRNMRAIRRSDTKPEVALRSALHALGFRFRKDHRITLESRSIRPDIVFTKQRVAIFVDGCFWHQCPQHSKPPAKNTSYWGPKLARNVERDLEATKALNSEGWRVLRIWEHVPTDEAVRQILAVVT